MRTAITLCPKQASFAPMLYTGRMEHGIQRAAELGCDAVELNVQDPALIDTAATARMIAATARKAATVLLGPCCLISTSYPGLPILSPFSAPHW